MQSYQDTFGVWHHEFRQSDMSEFTMCPEKLRTKPALAPGSDATAMGTAMHTGVETFLHSGGTATFDEVLDAAIAQLLSEWDEVRHIQVDSVHEAQYIVKTMVSTFWKRRTHFPLGGEIEKRFKLKNVYVDTKRTISFTGTPDYKYRPHNRIFDWKSNAASFHKDLWKHQRYAVQPTMYAMAEYAETGNLMDFVYVRFPKNGDDMEMATITRDENDFKALIFQAVNLAHLIESGIPTWPLMSTDWWCSAKWCDTFRAGDCMGKYHAERKHNVIFMNPKGVEQ